jgi:hypothetical protein
MAGKQGQSRGFAGGKTRPDLAGFFPICFNLATFFASPSDVLV